MIFHSNFGISESTDELDSVLDHTVSELQHPSHVPVQHAEHNFVTPKRMKLLTKGYPISSTTGFIKE